MSEERPLREADFNAAFQAVRDEMRSGFGSVGERLHGVESFQQAQLLAKVNEAEARGKEASRLEALGVRMDKLENRVFGGLVAFVGMVLWWVFERVMGKGGH